MRGQYTVEERVGNEDDQGEAPYRKRGGNGLAEDEPKRWLCSGEGPREETDRR